MMTGKNPFTFKQ